MLVIAGFFACDRISGLKGNANDTRSSIKGTAAGNRISGLTSLPNFLSYDMNPNLSPGAMPAYNAVPYPTIQTQANTTTLPANDYQDVRVHYDPAGDTVQAEEQIAINPTNPNNMIISANTIPAEQGYYVSNDGGNTWQGANSLPGIHNTTTIAGDPSVTFDANGNGYISTIRWNTSYGLGDGYYVFKSPNGGTSWNNKVPGLSTSEPGFDKDMIAADNYSGSPYASNLYAAWDVDLNIHFNRSTDGGQSFSSPKTFSSSHYGKGPDIATGPNGNVYVCWEDLGTSGPPSQGVMFDESTDGGKDFNGAVQAFSVNGMDPNGSQGDSKFDNTRVNDFPSIAVDQSNDNCNGRIYIAYAEEVGGKSVIRVRYSDDGNSWSSPVTVSESNAVQAWFPWIAVAPNTGIVSVAYYALNSSSNWETDTWVAYSSDGGGSFKTLKVSDVSHVTESINTTMNQNLFAAGYAGDYIGIAAYDSSAWATWADQRNGMWQVYVSKVSYTPAPPLNVSVNGPTSLSNGEAGTWRATVTGGITPYSYHWQYEYRCKTSKPVIAATGASQPECIGCGSGCGTWLNGGYDPVFDLTGNTQYAGVDVEVTVTDHMGTQKTVEAPYCMFY